MPKIKLTKTAISKLEKTDKVARYWDTEITGFGLKITPADKRVFIFVYRIGGRRTSSKTYTIRHDNPHQAREEAKRLQGMVAEGIDPAAERKAKVAAREANKEILKSNLVKDVVSSFIKSHVLKNRSHKETTRILEKEIVAVWGDRSIHSITDDDVDALLESIVDRGSPVMANRVFSAMRKMFNWAVKKKKRYKFKHSPCDDVDQPTETIERERVLSDSELVAILRATQDLSRPFNAIVQLLIYTAQRRTEVAEMKWSELDLKTSEWTLPALRSKNGKSHIVHLSQPALDIITSMPRIGPYVFTSNPKGEIPFKNYSRGKRWLDDISGVTNWRLHDIRRTVATNLAKIQVPQEVVEKLLNHLSGKIKGVAAIYQRYQYIDERRDALNSWAEYVTRLLKEQQANPPDSATDNGSNDAADNVIPINKAVG